MARRDEQRLREIHRFIRAGNRSKDGGRDQNRTFGSVGRACAPALRGRLAGAEARPTDLFPPRV